LRRNITTIVFPFVPAVVGIFVPIAYLIAPRRHEMPMMIAGSFVFSFVQILLPRCRPRPEHYLTPLNWFVLVFFSQLLILPMVIVLFGAQPGTLPFLPSDQAMNAALFLNLSAYVCMGVSFSWMDGRLENREEIPSPGGNQAGLSWMWALIFFSVGLIGLILKYSSVDRFIGFISDPLSRASLVEDLEGRVTGALSTFMIPFLPWTFVILWEKLFKQGDGDRSRKHFALPTVIIGFFLLASIFVNTAMNRNPLFVATLSLMAVYSIFCRPIRLYVLLILGVMSFVVIPLLGILRNYNISSLMVVLNESPWRLADGARLSMENIQVYGAGPQFLGYMIENIDFETELFFGKSILASILQPLPILGRPFRDISSVRIYNEMIYGSGVDIEDQIVPFQGELFMNFHLPGIIVGFFLLGIVLAFLNRKFLSSLTPAEGYAWFFVSLWILFLITGSSAVVSQMFIFTLWPAYAVFVVLRSGKRAF